MLSKDYILGFVEGEGCFSIAISRNIDRKPRKNVGKQNKIKNPFLIRVSPSFRVTNIEANRRVLEEIKDALGVGSIYCQDRGKLSLTQQKVAYFYTRSFDDCLKVRDYFKELSFVTKKGQDFILWSKCLELIVQGKHRTNEGILEICALRDQMNYRPTKNKWTIEEVRKVLEEKPLHFSAHFDPNQQQLIHNKSNPDFNQKEWLAPKQGNSKPTHFA